jgi:hypothetical protein
MAPARLEHQLDSMRVKRARLDERPHLLYGAAVVERRAMRPLFAERRHHVGGGDDLGEQGHFIETQSLVISSTAAPLVGSTRDVGEPGEPSAAKNFLGVMAVGSYALPLDRVERSLLVPCPIRDGDAAEVVHARGAPKKRAALLIETRRIARLLGEDRHATAVRERVHALQIPEAAEGDASAVDVFSG